MSVPILALSNHLFHQLHKKKYFDMDMVSKLSSHLPDAIIHCSSQKIILDNLSGHFGELSDSYH